MRAVRAEFAHAGKIAGAKAELTPVEVPVSWYGRHLRCSSWAKMPYRKAVNAWEKSGKDSRHQLYASSRWITWVWRSYDLGRETGRSPAIASTT